jgi:PAS domain S-box-containing protein
MFAQALDGSSRVMTARLPGDLGPVRDTATAVADYRERLGGVTATGVGTREFPWSIATAICSRFFARCSGYSPRVPSDDPRTEQLMLLVDSVQDYAIFLLDPDGIVATWSRGAERIKGYRADEIIGRHFSTFYTPEAIARDHPAHELEIAVEEGRFEEEGWRVRRDGTRFWANVVITALFDASGTHVGFGKVTRDLTERRALQQDLLRSNADLQRFAALAAHDLAEPLRTIGGFADLVSRRYAGQFPEEAVPFLEQIVSGVSRMDALIESLLGYARAGELPPGDRFVRLEPVAYAVLGDLQAATEAANATVTIDVPYEAEVRAGEYGVALVLQNLISNALKFGERPSPRIAVHARAREAFWRISVRDHGAGIPAEELDTIFEPFRRGSGSAAPGTGLGLTTCRRIVERHGGSIGVESWPGDGSEFWFTLPAA